MEETLWGLAVTAIYLCPFLALLVVGGFLADYVLPRCPRLLRFLSRVLDVDLSDDPENTYYD